MPDSLLQLERLLAEYAAADSVAARVEIEEQLWDAFGRRCAVFISDLSGFSKLTERHSIVHFLAIIQQCRQLLRPLIEASGGTQIKTTADNVYAIFPTAEAALEASVTMQRRVREYNGGKHEDLHIGLCVGVGYGDILVIGNQDFFGHQLNLAFKLGEDFAEAGEILVTPEALEAAGAQRFEAEDRTILTSGLTIPHVALRYD